MGDELLVYHILRGRKRLVAEERRIYDRMMKGYLGEQKVAAFIKAENFSRILPLYDFLFEVDGRECQNDCLLLTNEGVYPLEIKSVAGDYYIEAEKVFLHGRELEIDNPFLQLNRARLLLERFLKKYQINRLVHGRVLFVNKKFSLYQAPRNLPMLLPGQWRQYLQRMEQHATRLSDQTRNLADFLHSKRKLKSDNARMPRYVLSELARGVFCDRCAGKLKRVGRMFFSCSTCETKQHIDKVILHNTAIFHFLFPEALITVGSLHDWMGGEVHRTKIGKTLREQLTFYDKGRYSYYTFKNDIKMSEMLKDFMKDKLS